MKTGYPISGAKRAAVHRILFSPILSAAFYGQTPFFTPIALKETMTTATGVASGLNIFPSCLALRERRRSHTKTIVGHSRPVLERKGGADPDKKPVIRTLVELPKVAVPACGRRHRK